MAPAPTGKGPQAAHAPNDLGGSRNARRRSWRHTRRRPRGPGCAQLSRDGAARPTAHGGGQDRHRGAEGATAREFSAAPALNTTDRGTTNISAFQSVSLASPTGKVSVARITFDVVATARTTASIGLTVNHLFDTDSMPILPATGAGCSVSVTGPTSTSTSTPSAAAATTP